MSESNYEKDILKSIQDLPIIEYSKEKNIFYVTASNPSKEAIQQLYKLAHRLRENLISIPKSTLRLDEIDTGYRDRCLQSYCYDTLYLNKSGNDTCWENNAFITKSLGRSDDIELHENDNKMLLLEKLSKDPKNFVSQSILRETKKNPYLLDSLIKDDDGFLHFKADIVYRRKGIKSYLKSVIRRSLKYPKGKNISKIVKSISLLGWDPNLAKIPQSGGLGFSKQLGKYQVIHGKHRLAALKYLNSIGKVPNSLIVNYPVISYDWGSWAQFRKYPGTECNCSELWKN